MKCFIAVLLVLGLTSTIKSVPLNVLRSLKIESERSLHDDLDDFMALVPKEKIVEIFYEYFENDLEVQTVFSYMGSDEFRNLVVEIESLDGVMEFYNYLQKSGLDIYNLLNKFHEIIELPPLEPTVYSTKITGGIQGLVQDIKAVIPIADIKALYNEKLETSAEFKELVDRLQNGKLQDIVNSMFENKDFQRIIDKMRDAGIDVAAVADVLATMLGLEFPTFEPFKVERSLNDDFNDFIGLFPIEKIAEIVYEYVETDEEVQSTIEFFSSKEFQEFIEVLEGIDGVLEFFAYLDESDLPIYDLLNSVHAAIDLPPFKPSTFSQNHRITGGLNGLIQDIKSIIPRDEIKALYYEKLESSPDFKKLVERLQNGKLQSIVDELYENQVFQDIVESVKGAGVDVDAIAKVVSEILGLQFPTERANQDEPKKAVRTLYVELEDFLDVIPIDDIEEIAKTYVAESEQVQEALQYVRTPEFRDIVKSMETSYAFREFLAYLDDSAVDVYALVNQLHLVVGLPQYVPRFRSGKTSKGLVDLLKDVLELIPVDDVIDFYLNKVETDSQYEFLHERLTSPKFQELVDKVVEDPITVAAIDQISKIGIDLDEVIEVIEQFIFENLSTFEIQED